MEEPAVLTCTAVRLVNSFLRLKAMKRFGVEARQTLGKRIALSDIEKRKYPLSLVTDSNTRHLFDI